MCISRHTEETVRHIETHAVNIYAAHLEDGEEKGTRRISHALRESASVQKLNLSGNGIRDDGATGLARALKGHPHLRVLDLYDNCISARGATEICHSLLVQKQTPASTKHWRVLIRNPVGDQGAIEIVSALKSNKSLRWLGLSQTQMGDTGACQMAQGLCHCNLKQLFLDENQIGNVGATEIANALRQQKDRGLVEINLNANRIGNAFVPAMARALRENSILEELWLQGNRITDARQIAVALRRQKTLARIYIDTADVHGEEAEASSLHQQQRAASHSLSLAFCAVKTDTLRSHFGSALRLHTRLTLEALHLEHCNLQDSNLCTCIAAALFGNDRIQQLSLGGTTTISDPCNLDRIMRAAQTCNSLTVLDMTRMFHTNANICITVTELLRQDTRLEELAMGWNGIGDSGAIQMARALPFNNHLRLLHLNRNRIGNDGALHLSRALPYNSSIRVLHLDGNQIGDRGAMEIGYALSHNPALCELDLCHNQIGKNGVAAIAKALHRNTNLRVLLLGYNEIDVDGTECFAAALQQGNTVLQVVDLSGNGFGDAGALHVARALFFNSVVRVLYMNANDIGDRGSIFLAQTLCSRKTPSPLREVYLRSNQIGDEGVTAFANWLKGPSTSKLRVLHLQDNQIGNVGAFRIADALSQSYAP